ncbi:ATP-binding protein [Polaromonas sp. C04]|uniref:sensor histidine kinase n=1 Tax=Polaromonas sp. C04 TaxID=1945857 RepID=UPI000987489E|nr:ATP-binding protein [Polaromonas sp. C04]OOG50807.1 two-component sensor histidine kinase [Polaromonas sp. C04]
MNPPATHSLRKRLLFFLLLAILLASVVQGVSAYRGALQQADDMFDYHLQQMARSLRGGIPLGPPAPDSDAPGDFDFYVQIWGPDGAQIFRSAPRALPPQAVLGFSDVTVGGTSYRVYSVQTPLQTVQIAQNMSARLARARALAAHAVLPIALMAPLLMLVVWWVISRSLAPVERTRRQVASRSAGDLSPLPGEGLPEEVRPLVDELNLLLGRVRTAFDAQTQFVANAAHELRSPLTALKLQAQALRRSGDEAAREVSVARLNQGIDRAIRLVEQLLALAREEAGPGHPAAGERLNLQDAVQFAVADVLPQAQVRHIDLGVGDTEPAWVHGQLDALRILLRNLLDNALKYTPPPGRVDVALRIVGAHAVLVVEDSGPGIAPPDRTRVFDRFFRAASDAGASGSGLGLAIVKTIADRHGATIRLDRSERLGGLLVEVRFPLADAAPAPS